MNIEELVAGSPVISLVGKTEKDPEVSSFLEKLKKLDTEILIYEPEDQDIKDKNDKWACYWSEPLGFCIELLDGVVAYVSFNQNVPKGIDPLYEEFFAGVHTKKDVSKRLRKSDKFGDRVEQWYVGKDMLLGMLYDYDDYDKLTYVSFGTQMIFSDPDNVPNRYSPIMETLYDLPEGEYEDED